ncbi:methyltransferase [Elioraea sp.]|uniref:methyltransferase n=1 Tax=Elioraea sp. TaxID=2185103 RepID=UPI0025C2CA0E|nr:methyltransferase [Elioraea sp.]
MEATSAGVSGLAGTRPGLLGLLHERLLAWRDRRIADPRFRAWAARFPLTRPTARREARALFDLCAGFVYSQVLLACVQLGLFSRLATGPVAASTLASESRMSEEGMARLLDAAVSLRLLRRLADGRAAIGPLGAAMVGNPGLAAMVAHHALVYRDLADPVALLRGDNGQAALAAYWPYAGASAPVALDHAAIAPYTALMASTQPLVSAEVLAAYDFSGHRCLLDVGGGNGSFLAAVGARHPDLSLMLFDLPAVARAGEEQLAAAGLGERARCIGGDFLTDALPRGADVISLVRVVHDHDEVRVAAILRAARAALPIGGTLLIAEPLADTPGAEPIGAAYFGFYLLAMGRGRARSVSELTHLLAEAGFGSSRLVATHTPLVASLIAATAT